MFCRLIQKFSDNCEEPGTIVTCAAHGGNGLVASHAYGGLTSSGGWVGVAFEMASSKAE